MLSFILTLKRLLNALYKAMKEQVFKSLLTTLALILLSGTLFYHKTEGWSLLDSLYFSFVSLVPTGLNTGLIPQTDLSKWFTMLYLLVGVGIMLMLLLTLGIAVADFEKAEKDEVKERIIDRLN